MLVGTIFQKAYTLQALQKPSDLHVQRSAQWTILLFKGEYAFLGKTRLRLGSLLSSVSCASHFGGCHHIGTIATLLQ